MFATRSLGWVLIAVAGGCGGDDFSSATPSLDASSVVDSSRDAVVDTESASDGSPSDGGGDVGHPDGMVSADAADSEADTGCSELQILAEADGALVQSNCDADNSITDGMCADLGMSGCVWLVRFQLTDEIKKRFDENQVKAAQILAVATSVYHDCDTGQTGPLENRSGQVELFPLRSDWKQGGPNAGAQWCYREGDGTEWKDADKWDAPGATGAADRGTSMGVFQLDMSDVTRVIFPLDPSSLTQKMQSDLKVSVLAVPQDNVVLGYFRSVEAGYAPVLSLQVCP